MPEYMPAHSHVQTYVCECLHVLVPKPMYAHACRDRSCPHCSLPYVLRQGLSLNLELMDKARLTGQQEQPLPRSDPVLRL